MNAFSLGHTSVPSSVAQSSLGSHSFSYATAHSYNTLHRVSFNKLLLIGTDEIFLPLNAIETCDLSGSLEQVASMLFANTKGLVYKPSSGVSTGYSADYVSHDKNGKLCSDNLYNLDPGFVV